VNAIVSQMFNHRFYFDERGLPKMDCEPSFDTVAWFLSCDVQRDVSTCDEWLGDLTAVRSGKKESFEGTGNLFTVILTRNGAAIENCIDETDAPITISLDDFEEVIRGWKQLLLAKPRK
jgi:hypothetical protein